jgi:hypothetical protein
MEHLLIHQHITVGCQAVGSQDMLLLDKHPGRPFILQDGYPHIHLRYGQLGDQALPSKLPYLFKGCFQRLADSEIF